MADIQVGLAIRLVREEKKLSQTEVGDKMGTTRCYISKIENSRAMPNLAQFVRFADALEVEPERLLKFARHLQRKVEASIPFASS